MQRKYSAVRKIIAWPADVIRKVKGSNPGADQRFFLSKSPLKATHWIGAQIFHMRGM